MKLLLLALLALLLLPLFRRLTAKSERKGDGDEDVKEEERARDASFSLLMKTVVVLEGNAWDACTIDGIREDWPRYASAEVRGLAAVPAGRHRITTAIGGRSATLDFVLYPGQIAIYRLDRDAMQWLPIEDDVRTRIERLAEGGEKGALAKSLVSYRATLGIARVKTGKIKSPEAELDRAREKLGELLARAAEIDDAPALEREGREAGEALVGVPLVREQLDALVQMALDRAALLQGKRAIIARIALAMLPGEARLLELAR